MGVYKVLKSVIRVELLLSITLFLLPISLPIISGKLLNSVSHYVYSDAIYFYNIGLTLISIFLLYDGFIDKERRFNILLGLTLLGVILFPVKEDNYIHDFFAIIFFFENLIILIYYSKVFSNIIKIIVSVLVVLTLIIMFLGLITLFLAETIGLFCVSFFFLFRFIKLY